MEFLHLKVTLVSSLIELPLGVFIPLETKGNTGQVLGPIEVKQKLNPKKYNSRKLSIKLSIIAVTF